MKKIYLLFFVILFPLPLHAYIDPGTGSMLFSLLTGLTVTVFFFFKNILIRVKSGSLFKTKTASSLRHPLVIYSEGKQYWNVFKPVLEELVRRETPCVYYTSGEDDPGLSFDAPNMVTKKFIGKGNAAYSFLNFLEADICLMTTPGLDVLQLKRSPGVLHYAHILHTVTDATTYRLFGLDYYDSVFLTGEYQKKDIRKLEELRGTHRKTLFVTGCTYLDVMAEHIKELPLESRDRRKTVLLAPSWGANGIMRRYGLRLLEPLARSSYRVIIRPHPQSMISEKDTIDTLRHRLAAFENVEWNFDAENLTALSRADVLISDFSGVVFDYAFLFGRPVVYPRFDFDKRPYDLADIEEEAWTFRAIRELGSAVNEDDFEQIEGFLDGVIGGGEKKEVSYRLKDESYMYPGEAGKRVVDALSDIKENYQRKEPPRLQ